MKNFIERLTGRPIPVAKVSMWKEDSKGVRSSENVVLSDDIALGLVQKAVKAAQQAGNMVIVGRGGQIILKDHADVLHVRIEAPMEERIQRVKEQLKQEKQAFQADINLRRAAQDVIVTRDFASADYIQQYYAVDWADPLLYHIVLNSAKVTVEQAAQIIVELIKMQESEPA